MSCIDTIHRRDEARACIPGSTPGACDPAEYLTALLERAKEDVGAPFEPEALATLRQLRASDATGWV